MPNFNFVKPVLNFLTGDFSSINDSAFHRSDGVEKAENLGSKRAGSKKRSLATISERDGSDHKRQKVGSSEQGGTHLTPYYKVGADAQAIPIPGTPFGVEDTSSSPEVMLQRPKRSGAFRPVDTLHREKTYNRLPAHAREPTVPAHREQRTAHTSFGGGQLYAGFKPFDPRKKQEEVKRHNEIWRPGGDGFDEHELRHNQSAKRRKLDVMSSATLTSGAAQRSQPVDLTGDEENENPITESKIVSRNNKLRPTAEKHRSMHSSFDKDSMVRNLERLTRPDAPKSRRKSKEGVPSSQSSGPRETATTVMKQFTRTSPHVLSSVPISVDDGVEFPYSYTKSAARQVRQEYARSEIPPIDLTTGPEFKRSSRKHDIDLEATEATSEMVRVNDKSEGVTNAIHGSSAARSRPRRRIAQDDQLSLRSSHSHSSPDPRQAPRRLAEQFKRDDGSQDARPTAPQRQVNGLTAAQRLRRGSQNEAQKPQELDDGLGSADELNGDKTVRSSRKHTQSKQQSRRSSSPSDIRPTKFTKGSNATAAKPSSKQKEDDASDDEYDQRPSVAVRAFYATSFVAEEGLIELHFDGENRQIDVSLNGRPVTVPGRSRLVTISDREVNAITWHKDHINTKICLQGPSADVSQRGICIEFAKYEDVAWFGKRVDEITEWRYKYRAVDNDRLEKTYSTLREHVLAYVRRQATSSKSSTSINQPAESIQTERTVDNEEEQIKYEDVAPRTSKADMLRSQRERGHTMEAMQRSPYFPQELGSQRATRSSRAAPVSAPIPPVKWTHANPQAPWPRSVVYPQDGKRRATVDFQDLERLDEGEFLNDNVISFALRYIEETMPDEHKEDVHFFNTFFFTSLGTKNGRKAFNYDAVKRWTKGIDLMSKPYVVVPINNNLHWFVAIIGNLPSLDRKVSLFDDGDDADENPAQDAADHGENAEMADAEEIVVASPISKTTIPGHDGQEGPGQEIREADALVDISKHASSFDRLSISDQDEVADPAAPASSQTIKTYGRKAKRKAPPPPRKYDPDAPVIITLDSFGNQHSIEVRYMKDYICAEADDKRAMKVNRDDIKGMTAKGIPQQTNFCDCGVYLVAYIQEFAKDPRRFVSKVLSGELDKNKDFADFDASLERDKLRSLLLEIQKEQEAEHKAKKSEKRGETKSAAKADTVGDRNPANATRKIQSSPVARHVESRIPAEEVSKPAASQPAPQRYKDVQSPAPKHNPEDEDELELAVPRAAGEQLFSPARATVGASHSSKPQIEDHNIARTESPRALTTKIQQAEDGSDEMLDVPNKLDLTSQLDASDGLGQKGDLLDGLASNVRDGVRGSFSSSRGSLVPDYANSQPMSRAASEPGSGEQHRIMGNVQQRVPRESPQVVIDLDEARTLSLEVPDSQDHAQGYERSAGTPRRTKPRRSNG